MDQHLYIRRAPRQVAHAAVFQGADQIASGIVSNISVSGACIATDFAVTPGTDIRLRIAFHREPCEFEVLAFVVWSRIGTAGSEGLHLHGVRFDDLSAVLRARLQAILDA